MSTALDWWFTTFLPFLIAVAIAAQWLETRDKRRADNDNDTQEKK